VKEINFTCADSSTPSGDACFVNNGTVGYIKKIYNNDLTRPLRYIYLKFCCSSSLLFHTFLASTTSGTRERGMNARNTG
jgi:hypothetical protein